MRSQKAAALLDRATPNMTNTRPRTRFTTLVRNSLAAVVVAVVGALFPDLNDPDDLSR